MGLLGLLLLGLLVFAPPTRAAVVNDVILLEDAGDLFEPANPVPFRGRRLEFSPRGSGYSTQIEPAFGRAFPGHPVALEQPGRSIHRRLQWPVIFFGRVYRDLFIHPHGAVSFGEPLPANTMARAADPGDLLRGILSGPPVVAALWNELEPQQAELGGGGMYFAELPDRILISWAQVASVRPADRPNTIHIVIHRNGRIELEYPTMATRWGLIGLSPGAARSGTELVDLATEPEVRPGRALFSWYRDRPRLNEVALARRVYEEAADRFDFLAIFTDRVVEGPDLVGSVSIANRDQGIGLPLYDHGPIFGSRRLEHMVLMNSLSYYDPDPGAAPKIPHHAPLPSTLAVLAHEVGHRWLAHLSEPLVAPGERGHWSRFLDSGGSLMGGSRLRDNADGTFTAMESLTRFGAFDQYLMGLRPASDLQDFFVVETTEGGAEDAPVVGHTFDGRRLDIRVDDLVARLGERSPAAAEGRVFRMGFVMVVERGATLSPLDLQKVQRVRRAFGPYFRGATEGRARLRTRVARVSSASIEVGNPPLPREPTILDATLATVGSGGLVARIDFLDLQADVLALEISTDVSADRPPAWVDLAAIAFGDRRGTVSFALRYVPAGAREMHLTLVDAAGRRSPMRAVDLRAIASAT